MSRQTKQVFSLDSADALPPQTLITQKILALSLFTSTIMINLRAIISYHLENSSVIHHLAAKNILLPVH